MYIEMCSENNFHTEQLLHGAISFEFGYLGMQDCYVAMQNTLETHLMTLI